MFADAEWHDWFSLFCINSPGNRMPAPKGLLKIIPQGPSPHHSERQQHAQQNDADQPLSCAMLWCLHALHSNHGGVENVRSRLNVFFLMKIQDAPLIPYMCFWFALTTHAKSSLRVWQRIARQHVPKCGGGTGFVDLARANINAPFFRG